MFRALTVFLLIFMFRPDSYGQANQSPPAFKNGRLSAGSSLLHHKINHPLWQSARYGGDYYVVIQMDRIADANEKSELASQGIRLEQWLSGQ